MVQPITKMLVKIESSLNLTQLEIAAGTPRSKTQQSKFPYYCPICLRYFSKILVSKCCKNYTCHYCAYEMNAQIEQGKTLSGRCCFCEQIPL